jgi:hypothetical protein
MALVLSMDGCVDAGKSGRTGAAQMRNLWHDDRVEEERCDAVRTMVRACLL